jgi:RND family efflux transporter MFP subunit
MRTRDVLAVVPILLASAAGAADDKGTAVFVGRVEPAQTVDLRARVAGQIVRVHCKAGDEVKPGAVLFELDPRPYQVELDRAVSGVAPAEARLKYYQTELARARGLRAGGGVSQGEYDRLDAERANSEGMVLSAKASVEAARLTLEFTKVAAPFSGRVAKPLAVGSVVRENRNVLATLVAGDPIVVAFGVDEKTTLRLLKGTGPVGGPAAVGFADEDGFPHQGKVDRVDVRADPAAGVVQWRLVLPNPDRRVLPGMSARVRLPSTPP